MAPRRSGHPCTLGAPPFPKPPTGRYFQLTGFEAWLRAQDIANPAPSDRAPSPGLFGSPGAASSLGSPSIYRTHSAFSGYAGSPGAGSPPPLPIAAVSRPSVWDAPDDAAAAAAVRSSMYSPDGAVYGRCVGWASSSNPANL